MEVKVINRIRSELESLVLVNEPMSKHTTWRLGGPADIFVMPQEIKDIQTIVQIAMEEKVPLTVIGNGSNLLVKDKGIRGITLKIGSSLSTYSVDGAIIKAQGGLLLSKLMKITAEAGIGGFEFLVGIPATIGGAVVMNAGAHGGAMEQVVREVKVVTSNGVLLTKSVEEIGYDYRKSNLQNSQEIVVEATLQGSLGNKEAIQERVKTLLLKRKGIQPLQYPNAGSVFKNPPGDTAGRLIDLAGCKGMRVGGAEVSHQHANFIINTNHATAYDTLKLIEEVQEAVSRKFGINLHTEIRVLGE